MSDLSRRIAGLSPAKRALLEHRLRNSAATPRAIATVPRAVIGPAPLSFAQQRMWFLDQFEPATGLYNIPAAVRLRGALDAATLKRSLQEIIRRHKALRTTFHARVNQPVQVILEAFEFHLPLVDLRDLPELERESEGRRLRAEEVQRPFDLSRDLMLRAKLLRLADNDHLFILTLHHIAADGWSCDVLWRELAALYDAFSEGRPSPLSELPLQYADYAVWQREWLQGAILEKQLAYWKEHLAGV